MSIFTRKDIEDLPDSVAEQRALFLSIYDLSPELGIRVYCRWMEANLNATLALFTKKDYFVAIVCNPDDGELSVAAHGDDWHDLQLRMLDVNPLGWPQTIINAMEVQRGNTNGRSKNQLVDFATANKIHPAGNERDYGKLHRLLFDVAIVCHEELVRRGSPFKEAPSYKTYRDMTAGRTTK